MRCPLNTGDLKIISLLLWLRWMHRNPAPQLPCMTSEQKQLSAAPELPPCMKQQDPVKDCTAIKRGATLLSLGVHVRTLKFNALVYAGCLFQQCQEQTPHLLCATC
eukprot:1143533-Pelagomonas_calceolata.AAC.8